jgi:hypothetical protein
LQLQQTELRGASAVTFTGILLAILFLFLSTTYSSAGILNGNRIFDKHRYYDFSYISDFWEKTPTFSQLEAEESKYDGGFEDWLDLFQQNQPQAMKVRGELEKSAEFQRRYDIQLAYDEWRDRIYLLWWHGYRHGRHKGSFAQWLEKTNSEGGPDCRTRGFLTACHPIPDWRTEDEKKNEKAWMAEIDSQRRK